MQSFVPLNAPRPVHVTVDEEGMPASVTRHAGHPLAVTAIVDIWRINDEWWRDEVSRLYYRLQLADGRVITVFEDLAKGGWYAQRYP